MRFIYKMFGDRYLESCNVCPYRRGTECGHPTSPSEMGKRIRMTWIADDRGYAVFPNDCPLETKRLDV